MLSSIPNYCLFYFFLLPWLLLILFFISTLSMSLDSGLLLLFINILISLFLLLYLDDLDYFFEWFILISPPLQDF